MAAKDLTVIVACCLLVTASLILLGIQQPDAAHRSALVMDEPLLLLLEPEHGSFRRSKAPVRALKSPTDDARFSRAQWISRNQLVHVITSRFMQHQASLTSLARARLELLQAITLPSLLNQTNQEFIWILRVDPKLDQDILGSLLETTKSMNNIVIHATNANPEDFRSIPKDFYRVLANPESRSLLESFREAAQTHPVLETRLDADDALMLTFVDQIQIDATKRFAEVPEQWVVWCIESHLEWQQNSPWQEGSSAIVGWKTPHCVTPGMTWGYPVGVVRDAAVTANHHKIHKRFPMCLEDGRRTKPQGYCLRRLASVWPMALRARTITSAGMANLVLDSETDQLALSLKNSHWRGQQELLWANIEALFGVSPHELHRVRRSLAEHSHVIAVDALKGQCTAGHSCKKSSKEKLQQLVQTTDSTIA